MSDGDGCAGYENERKANQSWMDRIKHDQIANKAAMHEEARHPAAIRDYTDTSTHNTDGIRDLLL